MEKDIVATKEHKQILISTFLDIAVGQTVHTATQFLQATGWQLEEAIQLFYVGNETGAVASSSEFPPLVNKNTQIDKSLSGLGKQWGHEHASPHNESTVRAPLPVKRDVLYDEEMFYEADRFGYLSHEDRLGEPVHNSNQELRRPGIWAADQSSSAVDSSGDNLASLYRPPFALMLQGPFEKAKDAAKDQNRWLLVNLQSTREFSSHMLNRDTWANEAVAQTIISNFIFWQVNEDTEEGSKVCTYYKLDSSPIVLVVDPVTGQKMRSWKGMIQPQTLLEDLLPFMDDSPKDHHASLSHKRTRETSHASPQKVQVAADRSKEEDEEMLLALAASMEGIRDTSGVSKDMDTPSAGEEMCKTKKPIYPPLPEEPKSDRNLLCRVGVRLPDGRRLQRNFLLTDPIQLLWSFCNSHLGEADARQFRLNQAIPGASKFLEYESNLTFDESGLSNTMISVTWD